MNLPVISFVRLVNVVMNKYFKNKFMYFSDKQQLFLSISPQLFLLRGNCPFIYRKRPSPLSLPGRRFGEVVFPSTPKNAIPGSRAIDQMPVMSW